MRNTRKILVALLLVMTMLIGMSVVASAAKTTTDTTLYLTPNANWKADNARFALYTWDGGDKWFNMTDSNGDGVYECTIPAGIENIIFCRMNPGATANNWNNKWNQTADLKYDGKNNHYTVKEGTWDKGGGTWSLIEAGECIHSASGKGEEIKAATCTEDGEVKHVCSKCGDEFTASLLAPGHKYSNGICSVCGTQATYTIAGTGAHLGTEWDTKNTANDMTFADGVYTKVYTNVAAGSYMFKCAQDHDWGTAYPAADKTYTVATSGSTVTITLNGTTVNVVVTAPSDPVDPPVNPPVEEKVYIIAGDVMQVDGVYVTGVNFLGASWDVTSEANALVYDETLGCYAKVYTNVSAGEYHFKVAENKSWDVAYGDKGGQDNCYIKVDANGSTVTILFKDNIPSATVEAPETPVDPPVNPPVEEKVYIIAGDVMQVDGVYVTGVNFLGTNWDVTNEDNALVYDEALGCYVKVYTNVSAGEYHFKVAENKTWDVSYGENGGADNCYIKVDADGSTVTILFKDGVPSATVEAPETPVDPKPEEPKPEEPKPEEPKPETPDETPNEPAPELNFFQRIWLAIVNFFKKLFGIEI